MTECYPKYEHSRTAAQLLMRRLNISKLPVEFDKIFEYLNIEMLTFKELSKLSLETISYFRKNKLDAMAMKKNDCYHIWYDEKKNLGRMRFSIAHEIGHICLGHVQEGQKLFKVHHNKDVIEKEADAFAAELIRPSVLLAILGVEAKADIASVCEISPHSAEVCQTQIKNLKNLKNLSSIAFYKEQFKQFIEDFHIKKVCQNCNCEFVVENTIFCPICGSRDLIKFYKKRRSNIMKYPGIETDFNKQALKCPKCDNEEKVPNTDICKICGQHLTNRCVDWEEFEYNGYGESISQKGCSAILDGNARYCPHCGNKSLFYLQNHLQAYDYKPPEEPSFDEIFPDDDAPF